MEVDVYSDPDGATRVEYKHDSRTVEFVFPHGETPYLYHSDADSFGFEELTPEATQHWITWLRE